MHGVFERWSKGILSGDAQSQCRARIEHGYAIKVMPTERHPEERFQDCGRLCPRIMSAANINVDAVITPADAAASYQVDSIRHPAAYRRKQAREAAAAKERER